MDFHRQLLKDTSSIAKSLGQSLFSLQICSVKYNSILATMHNRIGYCKRNKVELFLGDTFQGEVLDKLLKRKYL